MIAILAPTAIAGSAQAEAYRFWGYYQWSDGGWAFASVGPAETVPEDGSIEGWRFAVGDESSSRFPRTGDVFDDVCAGASAGDGQKRVAVVMDYGTAEDAPGGEEPPAPRGACAVVAEDASGADVLAAVAEVRTEGGFTCGIDGFPGTGCGEPVDGDAPSGEEQVVELALPAAESDSEATGGDDTDDNTSQIALIIGVAAVVLIGGAAVARMRR